MHDNPATIAKVVPAAIDVYHRRAAGLCRILYSLAHEFAATHLKFDGSSLLRSADNGELASFVLSSCRLRSGESLRK